MGTSRSYDVAPSAARLTQSLRDIGYNFHTAIADIVDNSVAAGATHINVETVFEPNGSYVLISDDGSGMNQAEAVESLRFGTRRGYELNELGRFGLGLKTGSFSQCRRLTVVSRSHRAKRDVHIVTLDLNRVARDDSWAVLADERSPAIERAVDKLQEAPGTVVVWEDLDRVLPDRYAENGWGRRRLTSLAKKSSEHLAMVFHRYIEGSIANRGEIVMAVNGEKLEPWNPFAPTEPGTKDLPLQRFDIETDGGSSSVKFCGHILPARDRFTSSDEFDRMSGPLKWNRQQGLYIYRADRLVQHGGWSGIRGIDEHTKLARASIDFDTDLDEVFQINVAKMKIELPPSLKQMLERPVHELSVLANDAYRRSANAGERKESPKSGASEVALYEVGVALKAAILEESDLSSFKTAIGTLRRRNPDLADALGL
ncbi:MAG: ATP-binding protein [Rubrobacteraceae bacterium]